MLTCACLNYDIPKHLDEQISTFYQIRKSCPVLKQLIIPDAILDKHEAFTRAKPDEAYHLSVFLNAYKNNQLNKFTESLHRFAIEENRLRKDISKQYKKDLSEKWLLAPDEITRYEKSKLFLSRLAELDFALWLEQQINWKIINLELYGGNADIEACSPDNIRTAFEVKFLGERKDIFELDMLSFIRPSICWLAVDSPINYLLFRVYEAGRQLYKSQHRKIVAIIVNDCADYEISFKNRLTSREWVDWTNPKFILRGYGIDPFLASKYKQNNKLNKDLKTYITSVNELWVLCWIRTGIRGIDLLHQIEI